MRCLTIGPCHDIFGGGSKPSGSTQTTVSNRPIPAVEDALGRLLPQAEELAGIPVNAPNFDTVVPFSGQTEDALQLQEQRALQGSPLEQGSMDLIQQMLQGDFLQRENPGFDQFANTLTGDIGSRINSQFAESGRLGSPGQAQALGRGVGDALAPLRFQDFQRERQNQFEAAKFAPQLAQLDYANIQALRDVGSQREAQQGSLIQDELNRFNFAELEPRRRIAEVLALIGGGQFGNQSQTTQPTFSNPGANNVAGISGLASIAASLFGKGGIWGG